LNVLSSDLADEQARIFGEDRKRSRQITLKEWKQRPWKEKMIESAAGLLRSQL
jgi:cardiolipin synthase